MRSFDFAWNAQVSGNAQVYEIARVSGDAQVYGNSRVYGNAMVSGYARVYGSSQVSGNAQVYRNALVSGDARVSGYARIYGNAWVYGDAQVSTRVYDALVTGNAHLSEDDQVEPSAPVDINNIGSEYYIEKKSAPSECAICLGSLDLKKEGEKIWKLKNCDHFFHPACIESWYTTHETCPLCRTNMER